MSRPSSVSPRPPAPGGGGGGGGGPAQSGPGGGARAKGLKDVRIDEEVKIAVNIALERFRYGDQKGEAPDRGTPPAAPLPHPGPRCAGAASVQGGPAGPSGEPPVGGEGCGSLQPGILLRGGVRGAPGAAASGEKSGGSAARGVSSPQGAAVRQLWASKPPCGTADKPLHFFFF